MRKRIVALGVSALATATVGLVIAATAGSTASPLAGCTTNYEGQTLANKGNLPAPYNHPPIIGVNIGNPAAFAWNQEAYTAGLLSCVTVNPADTL